MRNLYVITRKVITCGNVENVYHIKKMQLFWLNVFFFGKQTAIIGGNTNSPICNAL